MPRINKKTRIKGLPPKVQLDVKSAHTGSYPSISRASSDNRTGKYIVYYDDNSTLFFTSSKNYIMGAGVDVLTIERPEYQKLGKDYSQNLDKITTSPMAPSNDAQTVFNFIFDETIVDQGSNGIVLTPSGTLTYVSGPWEGVKALEFDEPLHLDNTGSLVSLISSSLTGSVTISTILKPYTDDSNFRYMFAVGNLDSSDPDLNVLTSLALRGSTRIFSPAIERDTGFNTFISTGGNVYDLNEWTHVVITRDGDGSGWNFYVNGQLVYTDTDSTLPNGGISSSLKIGGRNPGSATTDYSGALFSLKVTEKTYTADEALQEYLNTTRRTIYNTIITGSIVKGIADSNLLFTPGQALEPYIDYDNFAVDELQKGRNDSFWATGSTVEDVGEGFQQPLWAKNKIEIDITPSQECSIQANDGISASLRDNHYMCYWNKDLKVWESITDGKQFWNNYCTNSVNLEENEVRLDIIENCIESSSIGFNPSMDYGRVLDQGEDPDDYINDLNHGKPINDFGFPFHQKFHATSSNLIKLSDYIDKPFLLEKVVIKFDASLSSSYRSLDDSGEGYYEGNEGGANPYTKNSMTTFFVLNQRKVAKLSFTNIVDVSAVEFPNNFTKNINQKINVPDSTKIDKETGKPISTTRDLLTYMNISTYITNSTSPTIVKDDYVREIAIQRNYDERNSADWLWHNWDLTTLMSSSLKANPKQTVGFFGLFGADGSGTTVISSIDGKKRTSARDGTDSRNGRSFVSDFKRPNLVLSNRYQTDTFDNDGAAIEFFDKKFIPNPYIIFPNDNLIFGWQLPLCQRQYTRSTTGVSIQSLPVYPYLSGSGAKLTFKKTPQKIILYGSYIEEGKEKHNTLNQLLINDNVHEIIGDD